MSTGPSILNGIWCRGTESNCRHQPFQDMGVLYNRMISLIFFVLAWHGQPNGQLMIATSAWTWRRVESEAAMARPFIVRLQVTAVSRGFVRVKWSTNCLKHEAKLKRWEHGTHCLALIAASSSKAMNSFLQAMRHGWMRAFSSVFVR